MKQDFKLITKLWRSLLVFLCLLATTTAWADYYVAGEPTTVFSGGWNPATVNMTQVENNGYLFLKANVPAGTSTKFKVTTGSWDEAYPTNNFEYPTTNDGTFAIKFKSDDKTINADVITTWTIAGNDDLGLLPDWAPSNTDYDMSSSDGDTYTLTLSGVSLSQGTQEYKVCGNHAWDVSVGNGTGNASLNIPSAGFYDITFTFQVSTMTLSATVTAVAAKTYTLYVYDPNGEPTVTVDGTAATLTTEQGAHVTWYKYAFAGTTLPSGIVIRDHNNEVSSSTITPVDGATDYYYFPKYGERQWTATNADYAGPTTIYIAGSFNGWTLTPMSSSDGNEFTFTSAAFANDAIADNRFIFSSSDNWDDGYRPTTDGQLVTPGVTVTMGNDNHPLSGNNSWSVPKGIYTITFNVSANTFVLTGNVETVPFYLHATDASNNWSNVSTGSGTFSTTDGVNYTLTDVALTQGAYFFFSTAIGDWNAINASRYDAGSGSDLEITSGTQYTATQGDANTKSYIIPTGGSWSFAYNLATNVWTATRSAGAGETEYTVYVIDKHGNVPSLYAWDNYDNKLNGNAFPGNTLSTTEQINGETWYKVTLTAEQLNVIASLGTSATQTADIAVSGTPYYIVLDGSQSTQAERLVYSSTTAPTEQVQEHYNFTIYARSTDGGVLHAYIYGNVGEVNGDWNTATAASLGTETLADGLTWYKYEFDVLIDNYNLILYNSTSSKQTVDINGITDDTRYIVMLHDDLNSNKCNVTQSTLPPTAKMYVIGRAGGNPWATDNGLEMTKDTATGEFKLENVQIVAGSEFAFAAALTGEGEWTELNKRRLTSSANAGTSFDLTDTFTDKDNPASLALRLHDGTNDRNFKAHETAYYDITINPVTLKATITRKYGSLYMFYGDSNSEHWKPNNGEPMITTDGDTYTLSGVTLKVGDTFQFATQLSQSESDWNSIADYRIGSNATSGDWMVQANYINKPLTALEQGSTRNFKMDIGTAGIYRVIVNLTDMTVTLKDMAKVLDGVTIIHLEKTSNVTNPTLYAYDKETLPNGTRIHVDRPSRQEIANNRKAIQFSVKNDTITADNRSWWTWEVDNAIVDFWFTRGTEYYYPNHHEDESHPDMTDIQWRMAGELYLTWDQDGVTMSDYTRDYYAAAAQEAADCAVMIEGHYYAYFTNTPGWDNVFCHAWYTDSEGTNHDLLTPPSPYSGAPVYPGALCELVGYDKDGYEVWRCDLTAATNGAITTENAPVGIIFNNGVDIGTNEVKTDYATGQTYAENDPEYENVIKEQTGDFVYSNGACYDYCGVIVLGRSLGNIIRNGIVDGPVYTIEEDLVGVYFDDSAVTKIEVEGGEPQYAYGALYCKDQNNFVSTSYVEKSLQKEGETDYIIGTTDLMGSKTRHDQSNWVKLTLSTQYPGFATMTEAQQIALLSSYVNKVLPAGTVNGQLVNNYNPEMRLALQPLPELAECRTSNYAADDNVNVFVTGSFVGNQVGGPDGHAVGRPYFFVTPKPQEYALITWAVYGGNDEFFVPTCHTYTNTNYFAWMNEPDLNGYFKVQWDLMQKPGWMEQGVNGNGQNTGQAYKFHAIIRLADESTTTGDSRRRAETQPYKPGAAQTKYVVSPIDISNDPGWVVTAVTDLQSTKSVKAVRYYNVAGMVSDTPFDGMNIVVTEYNDGTQQTSKAVY